MIGTATRVPWSLGQIDAEIARRAALGALPVDQATVYEPIREDRQLLDYVWRTFGVKVPEKAVCPNHVAPAKAFCDAYFARYPVMIWKGSRGFGGKSFTLATLGVTMAATLGADVTVLGGSGQQSARILEAMGRLWAADQAPRELLAGDPGQYVTKFAKGHKIIALTASQRSVRGPHPQALLMDEIDEMALPILEAAQGQPMDRGAVRARTVLSSTHQYPDGTMTTMLKRAVEMRWPVYEWCWRETCEPHGWLSLDQVERKRQEITSAMWETEYDLQEPSPEGRAIDTDAVGRMFRREMGEADADRYELEPPVPGGIYATGADWARKKDWTVVVTLRTDVTPYRVVAYERVQRLPWPNMVAILDRRMKRYTGAGAHDGTGVGDVVAGYLYHEVEPVVMAGRQRSDLLTEYIHAVEHDEIVSPWISAMEQEHRYATQDDVFGSGHLPDTFAAMALAYRAARRNPHYEPSALDIGSGHSTGVHFEHGTSYEDDDV